MYNNRSSGNQALQGRNDAEQPPYSPVVQGIKQAGVTAQQTGMNPAQHAQMQTQNQAQGNVAAAPSNPAMPGGMPPGSVAPGASQLNPGDAQTTAPGAFTQGPGSPLPGVPGPGGAPTSAPGAFGMSPFEENEGMDPTDPTAMNQGSTVNPGLGNPMARRTAQGGGGPLGRGRSIGPAGLGAGARGAFAGGR